MLVQVWSIWKKITWCVNLELTRTHLYITTFLKKFPFWHIYQPNGFLFLADSFTALSFEQEHWLLSLHCLRHQHGNGQLCLMSSSFSKIEIFRQVWNIEKQKTNLTSEHSVLTKMAATGWLSGYFCLHYDPLNCIPQGWNLYCVLPVILVRVCAKFYEKYGGEGPTVVVGRDVYSSCFIWINSSIWVSQ